MGKWVERREVGGGWAAERLEAGAQPRGRRWAGGATERSEKGGSVGGRDIGGGKQLYVQHSCTHEKHEYFEYYRYHSNHELEYYRDGLFMSLNTIGRLYS